MEVATTCIRCGNVVVKIAMNLNLTPYTAVAQVHVIKCP